MTVNQELIKKKASMKSLLVTLCKLAGARVNRELSETGAVVCVYVWGGRVSVGPLL